ncbi:MAG: hypothetical protein V3V30_07785 [Parvularculaceae bacterium]
MKNAISSPLLSLAIILALSACSKTDKTEAPDVSEVATTTPETTTPETPTKVAVDAPVKHCFWSEFGMDDIKDVEELTVVLDGDAATGVYNWIPAYKDKRMGNYTGTFADPVISAEYEFQQEGQTATAMITITIEDQQVTVAGGAPELGLNTTIARVEC